MGDSKISPVRFLLQVVLGRWFMMFASFLIMAGAGATYLFGVYSKQIKAVLGYDQSTLNLLGSFKDFGANVGVLSGLLAEVTPPWFVLLVGSALNFGGYFMIWLAVTERISKPAVWHMCLYIMIGANSQNFANTGSLVTCVKNFPESRGPMLGLMKGFVGLSGAIFTQLYYAIYGGNDAKSIILLIGWLPAVISVIFVSSIRLMKVSSHPNEKKVFHQYLFISLALAFLLMGLTIAEKYVQFTHGGYVAGVVCICIILLLPLAIAFREEYATMKMKKEDTYVPSDTDDKNHGEVARTEPATQMPDYKEPSCYGGICEKPPRGEDYGILQALISWDMLILFVATFCGLGCSLTSIDNLGQIGESLGYPAKTVGTFVSLVSIWNFFGRVFAGFISEYFLRWKVPRPLMMTFALILPAIGDFIVAFNLFQGSVYVASLLIGFSFGAQLTLLFVIISELFGLKYYSTLFNCGQLASPFGSYILNVQIVGRLYDREARKQLAAKGLTRAMVKDLTCIGTQCYKLAFLILACVNLFGALVSFILVIRTKDYYAGDIYKKFRDEMEANKAKFQKEND